ncbi:MAG TPA: preprotein translocase subunit SecY [Candidatus Magasanikbacteria bacterium]|nr:preprotein translocase subunit SecY [Candidatus Magasanikbacteria bacterium]
MWETFQKIWKIKDVRNNILAVLGLLVVFRLVAHIPVPGVDVRSLRDFLAGQQMFQLLDVFAGGTVKNFSLVMLGVAPYITSSIIFQLLTMIVPKLEEMSKEGEGGRQKINMYTRWLTVPLAFLQSYAMIKLLSNSARSILPADFSGFDMMIMMCGITAGTMFLVWLGELISERKVGNGISLLIFAGIVSSLPTALGSVVVNYNSGSLYTLLMFAGLAVLTVVGVVFINEGQRQIPVNYAKQMHGNKVYGGSSTHLPLRVNMAGVIPIIFAISLVMIPPMIAQFFVNAKAEWLQSFAYFIIGLFQNQAFYGIVYFLMVFGFTYFYTSVVFHPQKIAENLQKQGGFVPGIRPGKETEMYLQKTVNRINLVGASFLGLIAVLPLLLQAIIGSRNLTIGGTSLLIVVAVAIETYKQIDSQVTMHQYDHL